MGKGSAKSATNLLRLSGLIFAMTGSLHVLRYFWKWSLQIGEFRFTPLGSLLVGALLLILAAACFTNSRK